MSQEIQINNSTYVNTNIRRRISLHGIEFDEEFLTNLVAKHLKEQSQVARPTMQTAYEIYMAENHSSHRRKFQSNANLYFNYFVQLFGDLPLDELRHHHITKYRDHQLARGLSPVSVRKHNNVLNAMINKAGCLTDFLATYPDRTHCNLACSDLWAFVTFGMRSEVD